MSEIITVVAQAMDALKDFDLLAAHMKVAVVLTILISAVKLSMLRPLWDKLGGFKVLVAPALSLALALVQALGGQPLTKVAVLNALVIGAGAVALHEFLDALKGVPVVQDKFGPVIDLVKKLLSGVKPQV